MLPSPQGSSSTRRSGSGAQPCGPRLMPALLRRETAGRADRRRSGTADMSAGREVVLLVDGYNMIGAWPELERLKESGLEDARDRLLDMLAEYQGYSGTKVYVIFDAHRVPGLGKTYNQHKLTVIYTKEKETADECIERLVG